MTADYGNRPPRLEGIDLARAMAMVGMLMVHVGPTGGNDLAGQLYALPHGRASVLFMLVAGIGVSLLAGSPRATPAGTAGRLLWRALLLLPLGLWLQWLDDGRLVILQTYALMFVLATGIVRLPDRVLPWITGLMAVSGPVAYLYGKLGAPATFSRIGIGLDQSPGEMLHGLVLSGPYPLITWIVPFVLGLWLGRRDLRAPRIRSRMVLAGCGVAITAAGIAGLSEGLHGATDTAPLWDRFILQPISEAPDTTRGWNQLVSLEPHGQMPLWLAGSTGSAVALLGLSLMIADRGGRILRPLVVLGQTALSFYVAHLVLLAYWPRTLTGEQPLEALWITIAFTVAAAALALGWRTICARGPLELVLHLPWIAARRRQSAH